VVIGTVAISGCTLNTMYRHRVLDQYSGDQQTGPANTELPTALGVLVVNQFGERLKNVPVNLGASLSGGGSLSSAVVLSDESDSRRLLIPRPDAGQPSSTPACMESRASPSTSSST